MNAVELIERKCDRAALTDDQIRWFITGVAAGTIPDYQAAAMLMAVFINGMDDDELATWTDAMLHSRRCSTSPRSMPRRRTSTRPAAWVTR